MSHHSLRCSSTVEHSAVNRIVAGSNPAAAANVYKMDDYSKKTLKLDSTYRPIGIISWQHAICLVFAQKASIVENYSTVIHSPNKDWHMPAVISLNRYVKYRKHNLRCSRVNIFWRDNHTCQYCGGVYIPDFLTMDHVVPKSKGGQKTWTNIVTACKTCNQLKKDRTPKQAGMDLIRKPSQPTVDDMIKISRHVLVPEWKKYI